MIYYISDIHFGDQKVFIKCHRPFKDLKQYEEIIIKKRNSKVTDVDDVYVLGDISKDNYVEGIDILKKLKGKKNLIVGNHDLVLLDKYKKSGIFVSVGFISLIEDNKRKVCICHYPLLDWMEFSCRGYFVYGHIHNKTFANDQAYHQIKEYYKDKLAYNAGVDVNDFCPVTLDEMIKFKEQNINEPYIN